MAQPDAVLPDVIVSADLEVFEDRRIYAKLQPDLYAAESWVPLRKIPSLEQVRRGRELLPVAAIPLVYYTRTPKSSRGRTLPEQTNLAFGGINNSAVKTVAKYVWETYGRQAAAALLENSLVTDMPIGSFQAVRQGQADTALCPSLYALRADEKNTFLCTPKEGALLIPSYFCARKSIAEDIAQQIARNCVISMFLTVICFCIPPAQRCTANRNKARLPAPLVRGWKRLIRKNFTRCISKNSPRRSALYK